MISNVVENGAVSEYVVTLVEHIDAPSGMKGIWYRYVIQRGESKIEGLQSGELYDVTDYAEKYAESLNERLLKKVYAYGSQRKK